MAVSRRGFAIQAALGAGAVFAGARGMAVFSAPAGLGDHVVQPPDSLSVEFEDAAVQSAHDRVVWELGGAVVETRRKGRTLTIRLSSPARAVKRLLLTWNATAPANARILNDHWERGYGDLSWQTVNAERILPWYTVVFDGASASGFGVKTQPAALCFWRIAPDRVQLVCDVRSGQNGVALGQRTLDVATVVAVSGDRGDTPYAVTRRLCREMCATPPRRADHIVYGTNDWYFNYGNNSREQTLRDAGMLAELTGGISNRPYAVVDGGWAETGGAGGGPWNRPAAKFGDMTDLARKMRDAGVRPGIWLRLTKTVEKLPATYFRGSSTTLLDPSVPEVRALMTRAVRRAVTEWGYDLVKHDYSTQDVFNRWGNQMGEALYNPAAPSFQDRSRTTAEIVLDCYRAVRAGAGHAVVIGCNTLSHLAAGYFELQRTGDDTSGRDWPRTRKMGVNTLAYRMPQHDAFYVCDPDCAPITDKLPWSLSHQWLDAVARSGTSLFVTWQPELVTGEVREALRAAFSRASRRQPAGEPLDWLDTLTPRRWKFGNETREYDWDS